jgi:hypothetical protein
MSASDRISQQKRCYAVPVVRELPRCWDPLAGRETVVLTAIHADRDRTRHEWRAASPS